MSRRSLHVLVATAAMALLLAFVPSAASAAVPAEAGRSAAHRSSVIVSVADASQMNAVRAALEKSGGTVKRVYRWNAFLVSAPLGDDSTVFSAVARKIPGVRYAEGNATRYALGTANDPQFPAQWGLPNIGAPTAWDSSEGSGVSVAVIDTGIDSTHPDLTGHVVLYHNYVNPAATAADDEGHGTHVSGIIAATRNNNLFGAGTAPKATLYAFKVLDSTGAGSDADIAVAIRDAVDYTPCRIISMSLGGPGTSQALTDAVAYARSKGALVIAAAGNDGVTTPSYPAAAPGVMGVGAVDSADTLASFSNWGSANLDIVAPGVGILSTLPSSGSAQYSGTSMATPFVSGSAALVWSARPSLTADQVSNLLLSTAQDLGTAGVDTRYGSGLVRPDRAIAALPPVADTTPPQTSSDAAATYQSSATVHLTAVDNAGGSGVAHTYYRLDGGSQIEASTILVSTVGQHAIEFWSVDVAGNIETHKTVTFTVSAPVFVITPTAGAGGSINPAVAVNVASGGSSPVFAIAASTGYHIADVRVDGVSVGAVSSYQFTNVTTSHTIAASFAADLPGADTTAPQSSSDVKATYSGSATIHLSAVDNVGGSGVVHTYYRVDGGTQIEGSTIVVGTPGQHSLEYWSVDAAGNVETPHKTASFAVSAVTFTITPSAGVGGAISPASPQTVVSGGASPVFAITADPGFHVADVRVDGISVGPMTTYQFSNVSAGHTIAASFAADAPVATSITIHTSAGTVTIGRTAVLSGVVSPASTVGVNAVVYVMKPGRSYWTYSSNRTVYSLGGSAAWQYKYLFKPGMTKGVYRFKAVFPAAGSASSAAFATSSSGIIAVTLR